jgi:hypothetical protein
VHFLQHLEDPHVRGPACPTPGENQADAQALTGGRGRGGRLRYGLRADGRGTREPEYCEEESF